MSNLEHFRACRSLVCSSHTCTCLTCLSNCRRVVLIAASGSLANPDPPNVKYSSQPEHLPCKPQLIVLGDFKIWLFHTINFPTVKIPARPRSFYHCRLFNNTERCVQVPSTLPCRHGRVPQRPVSLPRCRRRGPQWSASTRRSSWRW